MQEEVVDIREYLDVLLRRWRLLVLIPILAGIIALGLGFNAALEPPPPEGMPDYAATTALSLDRAETIGSYPDLVKAAPILNAVREDLDIGLSLEELRSKISATHVGGGILKIDVTDSDPALAISLADGVAERFIKYIESVREAQYLAAQEMLSKNLEDPGPQNSDAEAEKLAISPTQIVWRPIVIAPAEILYQPDDESLVQPVPASGTFGIYRNTVLGVVFGGVVAVAVAFLLEYLQAPVRSPGHIERSLGLVHLGSIPTGRQKGERRYQLAVTDDVDPASLEAIRRLATSVGFAAKSQGVKTLAVTSSHLGDGRSSVLANLGVALAAGWEDVILVDADLRNPDLHRYFNLDNASGLTTVIADPDLAIKDVIQETSYRRLKVIPSGPLPKNPVEILRSPRMAWLLQQLKESNAVVLLDTPPMLPTTDAAIVGSQAQGVLMVVNGMRARMEGLRTCVKDLQWSNGVVLGFVWNRMTIRPFTAYSQCQRYYSRLDNHSVPDASPFTRTVSSEPTLHQSVSEKPSSEVVSR